MNRSNSVCRAPTRFVVITLAGMLVAACGASKTPDGSLSSRNAASPGADAARQGRRARPPSWSFEPGETVPGADFAPDRLIGMDGVRLTAIFGKPQFVRDDSPAQLWRYRNDKCVLHLFLYQGSEPDSEGLTVQHYETSSNTDDETSSRECIGTLVNGHR